MNAENQRKALVKENGTVLLGDQREICCDGYDASAQAAAVTHFHTDHIKGLEACLHNLDRIFVSEATKKLLAALKGRFIETRANLIPTPMGKNIEIGNGRSLTMFPSKHVLGSCQVLYVDNEGTRIVYTGDFYYPTTTPIEADILVIDATYGTPNYVISNSPRKLEDSFAEMIQGILDQKYSVLISAANGKSEQLMDSLRKRGITVPFLATEVKCRLAKVYQEFNYQIGEIHQIRLNVNNEVMPYNPSDAATRKIIASKKYVGFIGLNSVPKRDQSTFLIQVSRYFQWNDPEEPMIEYPKEKRICAVLSDHADFNGIMGYIEKSRPKLVIPKGGNQSVFAEEVRSRFGVDCEINF